ncbi:hypothetical protein PISMIDRAFT_596594 [Pisolithus microcarpus 441]|uniref:Uncharacterized protein n=1 Tax=Pisolithus microcarpus 441 TaxID=765257 RepID=A0A0C9ZCU1_9AGAM|nr:hypothetical protein PISMIDRAFT_596594 [Pisolithus microcarpus 441]
MIPDPDERVQRPRGCGLVSLVGGFIESKLHIDVFGSPGRLPFCVIFLFVRTGSASIRFVTTAPGFPPLPLRDTARDVRSFAGFSQQRT